MVSIKTVARILSALAVLGFFLVALALTLADRAPVVLHIFSDTAIALARSIEARLGIELKRSYIPIASDQAGHMLLWFTGTLIVGWVLKSRVPVTITAFFMTVISIIAEYVQPIFSLTRTRSLADAAANVVGVGIATLILYVCVSFWRALKRSENTERRGKRQRRRNPDHEIGDNYEIYDDPIAAQRVPDDYETAQNQYDQFGGWQPQNTSGGWQPQNTSGGWQPHGVVQHPRGVPQHPEMGHHHGEVREHRQPLVRTTPVTEELPALVGNPNKGLNPKGADSPTPNRRPD